MEQTDLVLLCSKTYRLDEKFVDTAENEPFKVLRIVFTTLDVFLMLAEAVNRIESSDVQPEGSAKRRFISAALPFPLADSARAFE